MLKTHGRQRWLDRPSYRLELLEGRVVIGDFKEEHNHRHRRHSALGYRTPAEYCGLQVHPHPDGLQRQLNLNQTNPVLETVGLRNGDSPR